ncbi:MAG: hypothetical protein IPO04_00570 [Cytophagaceae bacterium]|nr:hypothetical protein [Cytophagaceae bacterium]
MQSDLWAYDWFRSCRAFEINNTGSSNPALEGITNGAGNGVRGISFNGVAGLFSSTNYFTLGGNAALIGHSDTDGYKSIYGISEGNNGQAGVFIINNGTNTNAALESSTNGTGKAAYFHGTNALETDGAIKFGGSGVGIIEAGKVLTSDALGNATWQNIVPYSKTLNESGDLLRLTNTGTGGAGFLELILVQIRIMLCTPQPMDQEVQFME